MKQPKQRTNTQQANRVSVITMVWNIVLSLFKFAAGVLAHSSAMVSDAVHSASDVLSTIIVMIGVNMAAKKPDKDHPYGHERLECIAAMILSGMLIATAAGIFWSGIKNIFYFIEGGRLVIPGLLALIAAVVSIVVKESMFWYTKATANRIKSGALMADAWHHRSDALSSIGSLIGIGGAMLGFPILDPLASMVIGVMIVKAAYDISKSAVNQLVDKAADDEVVERIRNTILEDREVKRVDRLMTRLYGSRLYVDIEIALDPKIPLERAHAIAQRVHDLVEGRFPDIKHCMIHVNPYVMSLPPED